MNIEIFKLFDQVEKKILQWYVTLRVVLIYVRSRDRIFEKVTASRIANRTAAIFLFLFALSSWFLVFLVFPNNATYEHVESSSYVTPSPVLVLTISILLAISDTGFNIISNANLGLLFQADSEIGFMVLNSVMSLSTAVVFLASSFLALYTLLVVEVVLCTAATLVIVMELTRAYWHTVYSFSTSNC